MLAISLTAFDLDPSGEQVYVGLELVVEAVPFAGASDCTVHGQDLNVFLDDLEPLARTSQGKATLVGGWGDSEYVQLSLQPHGSLGHIELRVMLREHEPFSDFRVEGSLVVEPQALIDFTTKLRAALQAQEPVRLELGS